MHGIGFKTRFAPSPSGHLHLGHVYAASEARKLADQLGGECLLRIEDIDITRCRPEFIDAIFEDLDWLGIRFDGEVVKQSDRIDLYSTALDELKRLGVLYPCFCSRKRIAEELAELGRAPQGEAGDPYPGICRHMSTSQREDLIAEGTAHSWRLDCRKAADMAGELLWHDIRHGDQICRPGEIGDVILGRKDCPASYHIAVVVDDAKQKITHVNRGLDLFSSTHLHRLLQELLNLEVPVWSHHNLVTDESGRRLAKRDKSLSIREMKLSGISSEDILAMIQ